MKRTELKFPMIVEWRFCNTAYAVTKGTIAGMVSYRNLTTGYLHENNATEKFLCGLINYEDVRVLAEPTKTDTIPVKIEVDATEATSKMEAATKAASDLANALAEVKALLK